MTPPTAPSPRARCHHAIRHLFTGAIAAYIRQHPTLLENETELEAATYAMVKLMDAVLATVDEFQLADGPPVPR